jgi:AcrR family transcriptional regulator
MTRSEANTAPSRGEETRARLIEAAADQFRQHGYHGTSMRQIARAAGMAVSGIYNHFANKDDVFAAVLDAHHPYHVILPALADTPGDSLEDFVMNAARRVEAVMRGSEEKLMPLVLIELVEFRGGHLSAIAERMYPPLAAFVERVAAHTGQMRDLPLPVVLRTLMSLTIGYYMSELIIRNAPVFQPLALDWYGGMMDIFLHGVVARGPRAGARRRRAA